MQFLVGAVMAVMFWLLGIVKLPNVSVKTVRRIMNELLLASHGNNSMQQAARTQRATLVLTSIQPKPLVGTLEACSICSDGCFHADFKHRTLGSCAHARQSANQCVIGFSGSVLHSHHQGAVVVLADPGFLIPCSCVMEEAITMVAMCPAHLTA